MRVEVLGVAQDGGVPHLGCACPRCEAARADPQRRRYAASLLVRGGGHGPGDGSPPAAGERVLVDATPDVRWQVATLPDRVVLTHAHVGHVGGLPLFGREGGGARDLPVHCTPGLADVLRTSEPFRSLVERGHVVLRHFGDGDRISVGNGTRHGDRPADGDACGHLVARAVEHRDELGTGTLSLRVEGPERSLYYVPDVDRLTAPVREAVRDADVALVDATFWSPDEVAGFGTVPHPTGRGLVDAFADVETEVHLTHLNHTNPLWDEDSEERERVREAGLGVVERGRTFGLG